MGKKGLDSANVFGSKKALNRILKMILYSAKKLSEKFSPTVGNHRYTWWDWTGRFLGPEGEEWPNCKKYSNGKRPEKVMKSAKKPTLDQ